MAALGNGQVHIKLDPVTLARELRGPGGVVARDLIVRAEKVKQEAIRLAPVSSGKLRSYIVKRATSPVEWHVGPANIAYSAFVSRGTAPHIIRGNPLLSFYWDKVGAQVAFRFVNHPGTAPNHYLENALRVIR